MTVRGTTCRTVTRSPFDEVSSAPAVRSAAGIHRRSPADQNVWLSVAVMVAVRSPASPSTSTVTSTGVFTPSHNGFCP